MWRWIKVAAALLEHETIEGKHVHEIIEGGVITSPIIASQQRKADPSPIEEVLPDKVKRKGEELDRVRRAAGVPVSA